MRQDQHSGEVPQPQVHHCNTTLCVMKHCRFAGENRYQATIGAAFGARKVSCSLLSYSSTLSTDECGWQECGGGSVGHSWPGEVRGHEQDVLQVPWHLETPTDSGLVMSGNSY